MPEVLLQAKTRVCSLSALGRWLPYTFNGNIAQIVGKGYYDSEVKIANNARVALLAKEISAQLNRKLSEAADDVSKFVVEVFVKFSIDSDKGTLKTIYSFQVNLYRIVSTLGGAPVSEERFKRFEILFVGSRKDHLNVPPWKSAISGLKHDLSEIAKVQSKYQEDGLSPDISKKISSKQLPVLIIGDSLYDAGVTIREQKAIPT